MACPHFYPTAAMAPSSAILPLGDAYTGECRAGAAPDQVTMREICNMGYARGRCAGCPEEGPDAVRFAVAGHNAGVISIRCVVERDYLPFWNGTLTYSESIRAVSGATNAVLERQAGAYAESYLRRKERQ